MLKKHQIISLLLVTALVSSSCFTVSADKKADTNAPAAAACPLKQKAHDHDKGQSCPLKKGRTCGSTTKDHTKVTSKNPSWKDRFFGDKDAKRDPATKPTPRARKAKAPSKSWWSFWGNENDGQKGTQTKESRTLKGQKARRAMKKSDKKAGKKAGKPGKARKGKKSKKGKANKKNRKSRSGKKGKVGKKGKKSGKHKKSKKNKKNKKEKSDVIEVK